MSASEQPPSKKRKFSMDYFNDIIKLVIGEHDDQIEIEVPRTPLCDVSDFFKVECIGQLSGDNQGDILLEVDDPKIFGIFIAWLFNGSLESSEHFIVDFPIEATVQHHVLLEQHAQLIDCFIFGEKVIATKFKNATMDVLVQLRKDRYFSNGTAEGFASDQILKIYSRTPAKSALRRMVVDAMCWIPVTAIPRFSDSALETDFKYYEEFYADLLEASLPLAQRKHGAKELTLLPQHDTCVYHEHPDQSAGYNCKKKTEE